MLIAAFLSYVSCKLVWDPINISNTTSTYQGVHAYIRAICSDMSSNYRNEKEELCSPTLFPPKPLFASAPVKIPNSRLGFCWTRLTLPERKKGGRLCDFWKFVFGWLCVNLHLCLCFVLSFCVCLCGYASVYVWVNPWDTRAKDV